MHSGNACYYSVHILCYYVPSELPKIKIYKKIILPVILFVKTTLKEKTG